MDLLSMRGRRIKFVFFVLALFSTLRSYAGTVRTIGVGKESMAPIYLKLGKSTVLRFPDKPRKVVVGNQNYYALEFIENDLAIQPLGAVSTNLFVYTESRTYGFILTPGDHYDDLVFVRWGQSQERTAPRQLATQSKMSHPNLLFKVGKILKVTIETVKTQASLDVHLVDCSVENIGTKELEISKLEIRATRQEKLLAKQDTVIEKEKLKPGEKSKVRLVLRFDQKSDFSLEGKLGDQVGKVILSNKFL